MKSDFSKNIVKVVGGNALGKAIGIIAMPVLTRLYLPEDFAELSVLVSMVMILGPLTHLGYAYAIPLSGNEKFRIFLTVFCLLVSLAMFFLLLLVLFFGAVVWGREGNWLFVLAIAVASLLSAQVEIFRLYYARVGDFSKLSYSAVQQSLADVGLKLIFSIGNVKGLIIGQGLHDLLPNSLFIKDFYRRYRASGVRVGLRKAVKVAAVYSSFPKYRLVSHLLLVASSQAPVFSLLLMYGKTSLGYYSLAVMAVNLPVTLIANSAAQVFYGEIAKVRKTNRRQIYKTTIAMMTKLVMIGSVPTAVLVLFGEDIFPLVFGEGWLQAGKFAALLAYIIVPQMVAVNMIKIASLFNRQRFLLFVNLSRLGLTAAVFFASYLLSLSDMHAIALYCMAMVLHYIGTSLLSLRILNWRVL